MCQKEGFMKSSAAQIKRWAEYVAECQIAYLVYMSPSISITSIKIKK